EVLFDVFEARRGAKRPSMLYCGEDRRARKGAVRLIRDVGFEPVDAGPLRVARYAEPFTALIAPLAYEGGRGPRASDRFGWAVPLRLARPAPLIRASGRRPDARAGFDRVRRPGDALVALPSAREPSAARVPALSPRGSMQPKASSPRQRDHDARSPSACCCPP